MGDYLPLNPNPNPNPPLSLPPPPPPPAPPADGLVPCRFRRPTIRATTEFDSESNLFFHKLSCKLIDGLAKLKLSCQSDAKGRLALPELGFITKHFKVFYDLESRNALLKGNVDLGKFLQLRATHDVKEQQGEIAMVANLGHPSYKLELSSFVPYVGLPRATLEFPRGEISLEEKRDDEEAVKVLSVNGIIRSHILNGVCTAAYRDNDLNLRYCFKDEQLTFIPSISLPTNALSFAFKRRFSRSDKLSYWYQFDSNDWSTVYKHTIEKDFKFKVGYDSSMRLGWASIWVGDEEGQTKSAPMKVKMQLMLQVPQDDINSSVFMFRVKKRWDF